MSYKIIVDSCCELPENLKHDERFATISLELQVGDYRTMDDETFDQKDFLKRVASCRACPKSACPSPEMYMDAYASDAEDIFVVTLSSQLSGSHNSAVLGKNLYHEKYGDKNIHICDSESASCGETQIALLAMELCEAGLPFHEIVGRLEEFRDKMKTYFVLDNLETLRKNGRLTGVKAVVASTLSIKPVMGAVKGNIVQKSQAIGIKKALVKMVDIIVKELDDRKDKKLIITHCNCPERAELVKELLLGKIPFQKTIILEAAGISSMYANDGGVIVTV